MKGICILKSQIATSSVRGDNHEHGGRRPLPFVFTEQGIAMLSAVLRSDVAVQVSIRIMDTFAEICKYMVSNTLLLERFNEMELKQLAYQKKTEERFEQVFSYIAEHEESAQKALLYWLTIMRIWTP